MALHAELLRESFDLVVSRNEHVTRRFYEILFERYPQVKPLFGRHSGPAQEAMLTSALVAVLDHVDDGEWLVSTLKGLGRKHVAYGVGPEMYPWVGESLLATLAEIADEAWSPEVEAAWIEAFGAIQGLMLAGAEDLAA